MYQITKEENELLHEADIILTMKKVLIQEFKDPNKDLVSLRNTANHIENSEKNWNAYFNKEIKKKEKMVHDKKNQNSLQKNKNTNNLLLKCCICYKTGKLNVIYFECQINNCNKGHKEHFLCNECYNKKLNEYQLKNNSN
ncbi:MAG: hypothetical protein C5B43_03235 [Verrucomicrobia bacterium]|nr:MAG: hypothetical protein C5B43_03235 [Verrucomicrobiota bacterium]